MRCWCGYLSGARCRLYAYGPADATTTRNPIISCLIEIQTGFTFLVPAYPLVLEKRPLNGRSSSSLRIFIISCILPKVVATSPGVTACRLNPPLKPPLSYRTTGRSQPLIGGTCRDVTGHVIQTAVGGRAYKLCQRSGGWSDATSLQVL